MRQNKLITHDGYGNHLSYTRNQGDWYEFKWDSIVYGLLFRCLANLHIYKLADSIQHRHLNGVGGKSYSFKEGDDC
ncbi:hypothetical protein [Loigolactobacillus coryniformis]|uniref:hypothetical protein n=1 Tax=Loigolactobacillus coryniformis TaxID=1610 RepID=UPI00054DB3FA|nr:hypothetical protein [Loigolactobacillus coryniformis]